jgi:hypothetical protein
MMDDFIRPKMLVPNASRPSAEEVSYAVAAYAKLHEARQQGIQRGDVGELRAGLNAETAVQVFLNCCNAGNDRL